MRRATDEREKQLFGFQETFAPRSVVQSGVCRKATPAPNESIDEAL